MTSETETGHAFAGYTDLHQLVSTLTYKPGWRFRLVTGYTCGSDSIVDADSLQHATTMGSGQALQWDSGGFFPGGYSPPPLFEVGALVYDSTEPGEQFRLKHLFVVPECDYVPLGPGKTFWRRWLMECIINVERHEAMEWFALDGFKCFYPEHGAGAALYVIHDRTSA